MRVPYSWLKEYVEIELSPEELAQKLTMAGLPVENIINLHPGFSGVVAGKIIAIEEHPHADHLKVCQVDVGGKYLQVVSGAPNMAVGQWVAVALEGARLPGGREIRRATFRGVDSFGMLCSAQELGLDTSLVAPEDREGIITLPPDAPLGQDVARVLGLEEIVLELEVTTNRADCLSILGVAREVAALTGAPVKEPNVDLREENPPVVELASIEIEAPDMCGRYVARVVRNVTIGPSPGWMQARLRACGMRPINNIVDITNYVMLEMGQPLHAFDYDLLKGKKIIVRRAKRGEKIVTLDGQERVLEENLLVIADKERAVAVAGVMGGLETEVTRQTRNILIESAHFDGVAIRRASRYLSLRSEASLRFERSVNIEGAPRAADRAAELMQKLAGGSIAHGRLDCYVARKSPVTIRFRPERVNYFLGTELSREEIKEILERLKLKVKEKSPDTWQVEVPSTRGDLTQEIDLVEEVARLYGYDRIPITIPPGVVPGEKKSRRQVWEEAGQEAAVACGLTQVITYSFINPKIWDILRLPPGHKWRRTVVLQNPLREEQSILRTTLLPGLLEVAARNANRRVMPVAIFELGRVFIPQGNELPQEPLRLAGLVMGTRERGWDWPPVEMDFYYLKGVVEEILERVRVPKVRWEPTTAYPFLHPGRSAEIWVYRDAIGFAGELHPDVLSAFDLPARAYIFELDWEILMELAGGIPAYQPLPKFPAVERDLAVVVSEEVPSEKVREVILAAAGPYLKECRLFDLYRGQQIGEGKKSLAFTLSFQREDRTLTDVEVNSIMQEIEKELGRRVGAVLRQE
ncbi:phenylalanyl-tRNA synthetase beta subunit [Thermanaeromonas toyohensis ToBE]|uniref:Phenylalanine--tRNA ligase beta subunit n=1 Tax=Thermanaeromonas toyohensis ToBE TaxID=698762 RepID=A0A1W1W0D6_9FIRM|nr:phenylalanine--tRNA ligase subunit beta [Thermanaeromonas toyohensis]SMB98960.1 phenylalanyl-tRNA synthetase beta subunit [Thermanaeromonas toyohensis ToBE]